jgi:hypothetical protein
MIRIDEVYSHTFRPWVKKYLPVTKMFFNEPAGSTDPGSLCNYGHSTYDYNYILFHDQEPIYLDLHLPLFDEVMARTLDSRFWANKRPMDFPKKQHASIVVSEWESDALDEIKNRYGWTSYHYFFHGWAALDWYRGYNQTFLITPPEHRKLLHSFINPNRIIGGKRNHRVLLFYWLRSLGVKHDLSSFPNICPVEGQSAAEISSQYVDKYPDIIDILASVSLPWNMPGEQDHPMHSCWLSLFDESASSLIYVVTETVFHGRGVHLTEKIFKPICLQMPFVLLSRPGSLEYLKRYGFKTFDHLWDENYDSETDDFLRIEKVAKLLKSFDDLSLKERAELLKKCKPIIDYNYQHFYSGSFEKTLWTEFTNMLSSIEQDFKC